MLKRYTAFLGVLLLAAAALWYSLSPRFPVSQGLDLRGGMRVTLEPDPAKPEGRNVSVEMMEQVRSVLENRVNRFGLSGAEVRLKGDRQVLITLPGAKNPQDALRALVTVAQLEFRHLESVQSPANRDARHRMDVLPGDPAKGEPDTYRFFDAVTGKAVPTEKVLEDAPVIVRGNSLKPVSKGEIDPLGGEPIVTFEFEPEGARTFGEFTSGNVGQILAVVLDGRIITAPNIETPITEGHGRISGGFKTMAEARLLADLLNSGALPVPMVPAETQTVGATLGQESIDRSIQAGLAGLGIVLLFMLGYYWLPGVVACLALVIYAAITFSLFKGFPFWGIPPIVLDLPGITGFILSIGMAVDGNVLIFERLKEELREGKPLDRAIDSGFRRAFSAIIDSNVTVWIISAILIWLGTPMVKGFAITLAIGNAVAMFTAITVTRVLLQALTGMRWARNPALYGIRNSWLNLFFPAWRRGAVMRIWEKRRLYFGFSGALVLASLVFLALSPFGMGLRPGIDFTGGSVLEVAFRNPGVTRAQVVRVLDRNGIRDASVRIGHSEQPGGRVTVAEISTKQLPPAKLQEVRSALGGIGGGAVEAMSRVTSIGPSIAAEVTRNGIFSALIASLAMLLFLAFRFAIGGFINGLKFGAGAVLALFHDVLITVGLFAVMGWAAGWQVDSLFLTACLGLLGFSVNDTIVIYDRIRENLGRRRRGETFAELSDRSMTESFDRSVNTSFAIMLALLAMVLFGGETLRLFNIALLFGMAIGTYSSVFVASPLVVMLGRAGMEREEPVRTQEVRPALERREVRSPVDEPDGAAEAEVDPPATSRSTSTVRPKRRRRL